MLFPNLSPEEGWTRIEEAVEGASDEERWAAIEQTARMHDLRAALLEQLRRG